jgi:hypothetical protein
MIRGRGRVEVDCVRLLLHEAVSTGLRLSGRATFAGLRGLKMGQIHPPGPGLTIGLQEDVYYCGGRKRPMAGTFPARCTTQRTVSKLQARPSLNSSPLPSNGRKSPKQV